MVIGLLTIAAIPTTIGVGQAVSAQKRQNEAAKEKAKFHLTATLSIDGGPATEAWVVLTDNQVSHSPVLVSVISHINPPPSSPSKYLIYHCKIDERKRGGMGR